MIVSCLDHFIHEVRAVFLAGASYYSPVRLAPGFLGTKLSKIQLTLGKETRDLLDMPRPVTACFYNSLPHYHGLTKRETTAAHYARDRNPKKKEVEWDLDIEAYVFKDYIINNVPYCWKSQRPNNLLNHYADYKANEDLRMPRVDPALLHEQKDKPGTQVNAGASRALPLTGFWPPQQSTMTNSQTYWNQGQNRGRFYNNQGSDNNQGQSNPRPIQWKWLLPAPMDPRRDQLQPRDYSDIEEVVRQPSRPTTVEEIGRDRSTTPPRRRVYRQISST